VLVLQTLKWQELVHQKAHQMARVYLQMQRMPRMLTAQVPQMLTEQALCSRMPTEQVPRKSMLSLHQIQYLSLLLQTILQEH
jgi:hypothetical protein